jgi:hypothetical protein
VTRIDKLSPENFDVAEAGKRFERDDHNVKDDDGNALLSEDETFATLEVAHIIPRSLLSLTNEEGERELVSSHRMASSGPWLTIAFNFHLSRASMVARTDG